MIPSLSFFLLNNLKFLRNRLDRDVNSASLEDNSSPIFFLFRMTVPSIAQNLSIARKRWGAAVTTETVSVRNEIVICRNLGYLTVGNTQAPISVLIAYGFQAFWASLCPHRKAEHPNFFSKPGLTMG